MTREMMIDMLETANTGKEIMDVLDMFVSEDYNDTNED